MYPKYLEYPEFYYEDDEDEAELGLMMYTASKKEHFEHLLPEGVSVDIFKCGGEHEYNHIKLKFENKDAIERFFKTLWSDIDIEYAESFEEAEQFEAEPSGGEYGLELYKKGD